MDAKPDYIKERIKLLTEWFKFVCTLFVLNCGAIGYLVSKTNLLDSALTLYLTSFSILSVILLSVILFFINKKIIKFVNQLNSV